MGEPGGDTLAPLSNSESTAAVDGRQSGHGGKLRVREGDNPDRG